MELILASTSPYRQNILKNLNIKFKSQAPHCDETPREGENAKALVERLAREKALSIAKNNPEDSFIIGSDQVATLENEILGKPHTMENALKQLTFFSGKKVQFLTGLSLIHKGQIKSTVEIFNVHFRKLSQQEIQTYLEKERPLQSAGSFKSEGLGILLFSALEGRDPNALIGLPLIALNELFKEYNINLLEKAPYN